MPFAVRDVTLGNLIGTVRGAGIRRVLLKEYGSAKTQREGGAVVLVGMRTVVATALDRDEQVIYRWSETGESGRLAARKAEVFQVLREEGLDVDEGEWTPKSAEAFVAARREIVG